MYRHVLKTSAFSLFIAACLFSIMSLGGCPVAQTPQTPDTTQEDPQSTQPETTTPEQQLPRPITPPNLNGDTGDDQSGQTTPSNDGGDDGGGVAQPEDDNGLVLISIGQPSDDIALPAPPRNNASITLEFTLVDYAGKVTNGEMILARDDDGDGEPDGAPVYNAALAIHNGSNTWLFDTTKITQFNLLQGQGFGKFIIGVKAATASGAETIAYSSSTITIDDTPPTVAWQGAGETALTADMQDRLVNRDNTWTVKLQTDDTSDHSWRILLDPDLTPLNGNEFELFPEKNETAGAAVRTPTAPVSLSAYPAGTYYYYYIVSDGVDPAVADYAAGAVPGTKSRLAITRRLISTADSPFSIGDVATRNVGATLQGFNFNDLAGSSMTGVPDVDGDGFDELAIVSRFGKPGLIQTDGVGWGEAYLILGQAARLRDTTPLNSVGSVTGEGIDGLIFTGIRCPVTTSWTEGISDVTTVPDMDADGLPEIIFSFPRVESLCLNNSIWQDDDTATHYHWIGSYEYDPWRDRVDTVDITDPAAPGFPFNRSSLEIEVSGQTWLKNRTQFTRGGIVIVSSSTSMLQNRLDLNRKGNRIIDLHETGQVFHGMSREDDHVPFVEDVDSELFTIDCDDPPDGEEETEYEVAVVYWDILQTNVGPFGFDNWATNNKFADPMNPPIANMWAPAVLMPDINADYLPAINSPCEENLVLTNRWLGYTPCNGDGADTGTASLVFPVGDDPNTDTGYYMYTGFAGAGSDPEVSPWAENVGARLLGQRVNDRFGSAISSDGTWLYLSAPYRSASSDDVPDLGTDVVRDKSGVIYQYRTYSPSYIGGPTRSQLWIENGTRNILDPNNPDLDPDDPNDYDDPNNFVDVPAAWPHPDVHRPTHEDYNMPLPHTYIIEDLGYDRRYDLFWYNELRNLGQTVPADEDLFEATLRSIIYDLTLNMPADTGARNRLLPPGTVEGGIRPSACETTQWPTVAGVGTAHYYVNHTPQIVGPHPGAKLAFVRAVGDIDRDGIGDFAVGSENIKSNLIDPNDPNAVDVGGIFIVYGRAPGLEGDYLLEELALPPSDLNRLAGVVFKGASPNEKLARTFDKAGNFDGQSGDDVLVGNEGGGSGKGAAIVLLGSPILSSPENGWTTIQAVNEGVAIRFVGEEIGDKAGANVTYAGDVDGDGLGDILIAAPGHDNDKGAVYLIYGSTTFVGGQTISLADIGTVDLPGIKFIGKTAGDELGGGVLTYGDHAGPANPYAEVSLNPNDVPVNVYSDGIVSIGDLDGDGRDDFAISAMLADPNLRQDGGEVYIIYGAGD